MSAFDVLVWLLTAGALLFLGFLVLVLISLLGIICRMVHRVVKGFIQDGR